LHETASGQTTNLPLHTQEFTGSSPVAPTIAFRFPSLLFQLFKSFVAASSRDWREGGECLMSAHFRIILDAYWTPGFEITRMVDYFTRFDLM
jgi:hypothetical protein